MVRDPGRLPQNVEAHLPIYQPIGVQLNRISLYVSLTLNIKQ